AESTDFTKRPALLTTHFPCTTLFRSLPLAEMPPSTDSPRSSAEPAVIRPGGRGISPIMACTATDLPQPDSPTMAIMGLITRPPRSEEHTSELQSRENLVCRLLLAKNN